MEDLRDELDKLNKRVLEENIRRHGYEPRKILLSSKNYAKQFIKFKWGYNESQQTIHRDLFLSVRKQCYDLFKHYKKKKTLKWESEGSSYHFKVKKFDELKCNLILKFTPVIPEK